MEIIFEIFIEGLVGATNNKKIPLIVRLIIASAICGSLIATFILASISALKATGIFGAIICWIILLGLIILWIFWSIKIVQTRNK